MVTMRASYWVDAQNKTRLTTLQANASLSTIMLALESKSNASVYQDFEGPLVSATAAPVNATYPAVTDQAVLTYSDAAGNLVNVTLPAPVQSLFLADNFTVDPTQLTTINLAIIGVLLTPAGGVVTTYVSGTRKPSGRSLL